ncbi:RNA-binding RNA annealing protein [Microbotryomycetes sp. JL201]|nr:RNA-binding RNA annealing protein [Microbotryomycetes sp. JL201]
MAVDQSLDDIISSKKQARKPSQSRRSGAGAQRKADAPAAAAAASPMAAAVPTILPPALGGVIGNQIIMSGLPDDVEEKQVRDLFTETVGPVYSVALVYDKKGVFRRQALIGFRNPQHATKASQQYNGRMLDNKNKIRVDVIFNPDIVKPPLAARLSGPPAAPVSSVVAAAGGSARQARPAQKTGRKPARGGARPKATLESLDAEMADYQAQAQANGTSAQPSA